MSLEICSTHHGPTKAFCLGRCISFHGALFISAQLLTPELHTEQTLSEHVLDQNISSHLLRASKTASGKHLHSVALVCLRNIHMNKLVCIFYAPIHRSAVCSMKWDCFMKASEKIFIIFHKFFFGLTACSIKPIPESIGERKSFIHSLFQIKTAFFRSSTRTLTPIFNGGISTNAYNMKVMLFLIPFSIARKATNSEWYHPHSASLQKTQYKNNAALQTEFVIQTLKTALLNQFNVVKIQTLPIFL